MTNFVPRHMLQIPVPAQPAQRTLSNPFFIVLLPRHQWHRPGFASGGGGARGCRGGRPAGSGLQLGHLTRELPDMGKRLGAPAPCAKRQKDQRAGRRSAVAMDDEERSSEAAFEACRATAMREEQC